MKTKWLYAFFVLWLVFWPILTFADSVEILTFSYPPYMTSQGKGLMDTIFKKAYGNTDTTYSFKVYPRKRAILLFEQRQNQELFLGERSYFPDMTDIDVQTILEFKTVFVYMKNHSPNFNYSGLADLKGKRVGVSMGSVLVPIFKSHGMIVDEALLENNIRKLETGRIDLWHTVDTSAIRLINEKFPGQRDEFGFLPDKTHTVDLIVKKGSSSEPAFKTFVLGFNAMVKNGEFQKIVKKFMVKNQP